MSNKIFEQTLFYPSKTTVSQQSSQDLDHPCLSVGRVADETGIPVETLRVWERRYQAPKPVRRPSGHRRYTWRQIHWLRRVAEAVALGYRPSKALRFQTDELDAVLRENRSMVAPPGEEERWLELVRNFQEPELRRLLTEAYEKQSPVEYVRNLVGPLVTSIGRNWAEGKLDVRHEHFASQIIVEMLDSQRERLGRNVEAGGPLLLFTTLPEEAHGLGLHMVGLLAAARGVRMHILGTQTPVDQIQKGVEESGAKAVGLSISLGGFSIRTGDNIAELVEKLDGKAEVLLGGEGVRRVRKKMNGVRYMAELRDLDAWLVDFRAGR